MRNFQWENFSKEHASGFFKILQHISPVKISSLLIIDAPIFFNTIWQIICQYLKKDFISKIFVTSRNKLSEFVDSSNLPFDLGGDAPSFSMPEFLRNSKISLSSSTRLRTTTKFDSSPQTPKNQSILKKSSNNLYQN